MKNSAVFINIGRGDLVSSDILIKALNEKQIQHAYLDVFEKEPTPEIQILMHPKISLTPHIGAATLEAQDRIGTELAEQIMSLLQSEKA